MTHFFAINEMFTSLQGESSFMGLPCFFIRLIKCNLNCSYCDTQYACASDSEHTFYATEALVQAAKKSGTRLVEITGGEPLLERNLNVLTQALLDEKFTVLIETNGSLPIQSLQAEVIKIMDVKTPSSRMANHHLWSNMAHLSHNDEVKFVIQNKDDFIYACEVNRKYNLTKTVKAVHFSPNSQVCPPAQLAQWILSQNDDKIRLHLQQHKIIWPNIDKGV